MFNPFIQLRRKGEIICGLLSNGKVQDDGSTWWRVVTPLGVFPALQGADGSSRALRACGGVDGRCACEATLSLHQKNVRQGETVWRLHSCLGFIQLVQPVGAPVPALVAQVLEGRQPRPVSVAPVLSLTCETTTPPQRPGIVSQTFNGTTTVHGGRGD